MKINFAPKITWLFLLTVFGLPIVMFIPIILHQNTTQFSIIYRGFCVFLSLILIIPINDYNYKKSQISKYYYFLLVFWIIYLFRIVYDLEFKNLIEINPNISNPNIIYLFAFLVTFLPLITIHIKRDFIDIDQIERLIIPVVFVQVFLIIIELYINYGSNISQLFSDRYNYIKGENTNPLNPISISRAGAVLALLAVYNYFIKNSINFLMFMMLFFMGVFTLAIGGSRGPALVFIIILLGLIILKPKILINYRLLIIVILLIFAYIIFDFSFDLSVINRLDETTKIGIQKDTRYHHWLSAISQFASNPVIGDQIFEKYIGTYPHNIVLEVLMATGILGFIPFSIIMFQTIKKSIHILKANESNGSIVILFYCYFLFSLSSGSIYFSPELWIIIGIILFISNFSIYNKISIGV